MVLIATVAAGCGGGGSGGAGQVSLAQLGNEQEAYDATQVSTSGWVREEHGRHAGPTFLLSDRRGDLVELQPADAAARYVGERVEVRGRFEVAPGTGRVIEDTRILARAWGG